MYGCELGLLSVSLTWLQLGYKMCCVSCVDYALAEGGPVSCASVVEGILSLSTASVPFYHLSEDAAGSVTPLLWLSGFIAALM